MSSLRLAALAGVTAAFVAASVVYESERDAVSVARAAGALDRRCNLVFVEQTNATFRDLAHVAFRVDYPADALDFGEEPVACAAHALQQGVTATFANDPIAGVLDATLSRANGLFPYPLVVCTPQGAAESQDEIVSVTMLESRDTSDRPIDPPAVVVLEAFECTPPPPHSTTTSTVPVPDGLCGDADDDGSITASDALRALRTAVGAAECPSGRCDTNGDGFVNASDSLRILRRAVGLGGPLDC